MDANETIEEEVQWGISYRQEKKKKVKGFVVPKRSPLNVREMWQRYQITKKIHELESLNKRASIKLPPNGFQLPSKNKVGLLNRAAFTRRQYFNYLATPSRVHVSDSKPNPITALKKKLKPQKCSARLLDLARPRKVRVHGTWTDFWTLLSAEAIERLNALLQTDQTMDPTFARCCFADMDRRKKKEKRKQTSKQKKKKQSKNRQNEKWVKLQVTTTADVMISYLRDSVLKNLSYKQMLLSDVIIGQLLFRRYLTFKPFRNSKKLHQRCIYEVVDQIAIWVDGIVCYVDAQYTDSFHRISDLGFFEEGESQEGEENTIARYVLPPVPQYPKYPINYVVSETAE